MISKYPYILAVIFGLLVPFIPEINPFPFILALIYFLGGIIFGFFWPKGYWRWGIWIVGPMIALIALSVLFTGQLDMFLKKDLPLLLLALICTCSGSFLSAWFRNSRNKKM